MENDASPEDSETQGRRSWTLEERKLAFYLYCQLPFGKLHKGNPQIRELARVLGRQPSAVAMKLTNFASLDPAITESGRTGLRGAAAGDREVWAQFHGDWDGLVEESRRLLEQREAALVGRPHIVSEGLPDDSSEDYSGESRPAMTYQRVAQSFFRRAVLGSYEETCCMSGVSSPSLLIASHIVPWKVDVRNRLNPRNGLCLSALHDRAFDQYLISLDEECRVLVSKEMKSRCRPPLMQTAFLAIESKPIVMPRRFRPDHELVAAHRREFLARHS